LFKYNKNKEMLLTIIINSIKIIEIKLDRCGSYEIKIPSSDIPLEEEYGNYSIEFLTNGYWIPKDINPNSDDKRKLSIMLFYVGE
jgi:hypothetical protein